MSISFVLLDIDECLSSSHACDVTANCTNTDGSHNCTCKGGYTGDGQSCYGILDQTQHHRKLLLKISRACLKFSYMKRCNVIYNFRRGKQRMKSKNEQHLLGESLFPWQNPVLRMRSIWWLCMDPYRALCRSVLK